MINRIKTKSLIVTLMVAVALVAAVLYVGSGETASEEKVDLSSVDIDLNNNENLYDLVFAADGTLLSQKTYTWNAQSNTRGAIVAE